MTETMLGKAASALAIHWYCRPDSSEDDKAEAATQWRGFESMARAALEAIREPDKADSLDVFGSFSNDDEATWTAMIDAILSQSQEGKAGD